jgi:colicin import membrane protein
MKGGHALARRTVTLRSGLNTLGDDEWAVIEPNVMEDLKAGVLAVVSQPAPAPKPAPSPTPAPTPPPPATDDTADKEAAEKAKSEAEAKAKADDEAAEKARQEAAEATIAEAEQMAAESRTRAEKQKQWEADFKLAQEQYNKQYGDAPPPSKGLESSMPDWAHFSVFALIVWANQHGVKIAPSMTPEQAYGKLGAKYTELAAAQAAEQERLRKAAAEAEIARDKEEAQRRAAEIAAAETAEAKAKKEEEIRNLEIIEERRKAELDGRAAAEKARADALAEAAKYVRIQNPNSAMVKPMAEFLRARGISTEGCGAKQLQAKIKEWLEAQ